MIPSGLIAIWSGAIVDIPDGWVICDGNLGTPNLKDKFIVGADNTYAVGATGGSALHTHDFTTDGHNHTLLPGANLAGGAVHNTTSSTNQDTGTTDNGSSLPPYYALAFIMKT